MLLSSIVTWSFWSDTGNNSRRWREQQPGLLDSPSSHADACEPPIYAADRDTATTSLGCAAASERLDPAATNPTVLAVTRQIEIVSGRSLDADRVASLLDETHRVRQQDFRGYCQVKWA